MDTTYWLARVAGGDTEGPFDLPQLRTMYNNGAITAASVVCEVGSEQWVPVAEVIKDEGAAMPEDVRKPAGKAGRSVHTLVALLVLVIGGGYAWMAATHTRITFSGIVPKIETQGETSAKKWVHENLGDSNAQVTGLGPLVHMDGKYYRKIKVREQGSDGAPVVNDYIADVTRDGRVLSAERADVFTRRMTAKYGAGQMVEIARALSE